MIRFALGAGLALLLTTPALAWTTRQQATVASPPAPVSAPVGSEAWLRQRGETYRAPAESAQDPEEVAETSRLNAEAATRSAAEIQAGAEALERQTAQWREEAARAETQRAQYEADLATANAAQAAYERAQAAWRAELAACERAGRVCVTAPPPLRP